MGLFTLSELARNQPKQSAELSQLMMSLYVMFWELAVAQRKTDYIKLKPFTFTM